MERDRAGKTLGGGRPGDKERPPYSGARAGSRRSRGASGASAAGPPRFPSDPAPGSPSAPHGDRARACPNPATGVFVRKKETVTHLREEGTANDHGPRVPGSGRSDHDDAPGGPVQLDPIPKGNPGEYLGRSVARVEALAIKGEGQPTFRRADALLGTGTLPARE